MKIQAQNKFVFKTPVIVNSVCQFDWIVGSLDICSDVILGECDGMLGQINISIGKADCPPNVGGTHPIS